MGDTTKIILIVLLLAVLFGILVLVSLVRRMIRGFQSSIWGAFYRMLHQELKEDGRIDLKEYDLEADIKNMDSNYSKDEFSKMVEDVFHKYCHCMSTNDSRLLKAFETDSLFERHRALLDANKNQRIKEIHQIHQYLGSKVLQIASNDKALIQVELRANLRRYRMDKNGNPVSGYLPDAKTEIYRLRFVKNKIKSATGEEKGVNCPNCGAPHQVQTAGICEYCGTLIITKKSIWLLDDIQRA